MIGRPMEDRTSGQSDASATKRGTAVYSDVCDSCHLENGVGQPRYFPPLGNNAVVQQTDWISLQHMIPAGRRIGISAEGPTPLTMPSFARELSDAETADVATYIRNSWGNRVPAVSASAVVQLRKQLDVDRLHPTVNSGDQN